MEECRKKYLLTIVFKSLFEEIIAKGKRCPVISLQGAKSASSARICGTKSGWRGRDTADGWTWRDYFAIHLWCPMMVSERAVVVLFVTGARTRQCCCHRQKIPSCRSIGWPNDYYADQLYGERVMETHGYPNKALT
jgi:hypothetical protein